MDTFIANHSSVDQQQLVHERERLLSLMVTDMKFLKSYLNELKEIGLELKTAGRFLHSKPAIV